MGNIIKSKLTYSELEVSFEDSEILTKFTMYYIEQGKSLEDAMQIAIVKYHRAKDKNLDIRELYNEKDFKTWQSLK